MRSRTVELLGGCALGLYGLITAPGLLTPGAVVAPWRSFCAERGVVDDITYGVVASLVTTTLLVASALLRHRRPVPVWSRVVVGMFVAAPFAYALAASAAQYENVCIDTRTTFGGAGALLSDAQVGRFDYPASLLAGSLTVVGVCLAWRRSTRAPTPS